MFSRRHVLAALLVFVAMPAMAEEDVRFQGVWKITGSVSAPWAKTPAAVTGDDQKLDGKLVTIHSAAIDGPELMGCGKTDMTIETLPFAGLFEGGLAADANDPAASYDEAKAGRLARQLGFTAEPVATLFQGCSEISFHLRDASTLMFGLNDRIFTLKKQ